MFRLPYLVLRSVFCETCGDEPLSYAFGLQLSSLKHRYPFPLRGEVDNRVSPPLFAVLYPIYGFPH